MNEGKIVLEIKGMGHVPSKKNHHFPLTNGGLGLDKNIREWMAACQARFVSQLTSGCPTIDGATLTVDSLRSLIASLPRDDAWQIISKLEVTVTRVKKGEEGCLITIERI